MYRKILCFMVLLSIVESRKYDLQSEAVKLYGEDLHSVLAKFRKSADYLKILEDSLAEVNLHIHDLGLQATFHYTSKLGKRIYEMLGVDRQTTAVTTSVSETDKAPWDKLFQKAVPNYKKGQQGEPVAKDAEEDTTGPTPVEILEGYHLLASPLTMAEKNSFIDVGFEFIGHIIHTIIKNMGTDDSSVKSTMQAYGGNEFDKKRTTTTTEHALVHEVTTLTAGNAEETKATVEAYRYKYRTPMLNRKN